VQEELLNSD